MVIGLTAALAYELPYDPFYPEEELQEIYEDGHLPLLELNIVSGEEDDEDYAEDVDGDGVKRHDKFTNSTKRKKTKTKTQPTTSIKQSAAPLTFSNTDYKYYNQVNNLNQPRPPSINPFTYSQPHPYYKNYDNNKLPPLDTTYYYPSDGRLPQYQQHNNNNGGYYNQQPGAVVPPTSNKLEYFLSTFADKIFSEFNAQQKQKSNAATATTSTTTQQSTDNLKRNDVKYGL